MDRTEASDAFNAGSIPAGCIYITLIHSWKLLMMSAPQFRKVVNMWKDYLRIVRDYIVKNCKVIFPVIVIVAVAMTVIIALNAKDPDNVMANESGTSGEEASEGDTSEAVPEELSRDVVLERNEDGSLYALIATYYNAHATGDVATIRSICNHFDETEEIRALELSEYIESYPHIEIYTKTGPEANSLVVYVYMKVTFYGYEEEVPGLQTFYVCTNADGTLYINRGEVSDEALAYISEVTLQDDVVELNNRITVECNELYINNTQLFDYMMALDESVQKAIGEKLAARIQETAAANVTGNEENAGEAADDNQEAVETGSADVVNGPVYAVATTTVNVRSSDSEQADRIGKVAGGTKVQILEQKVNGWSKVQYEAGEGYIKSEFLQVAETAADGDVIGSVTATTNVNIRSSASETAEKIGIASGGDILELISQEGDWSKIRYNGQVGYVKSEFVQ